MSNLKTTIVTALYDIGRESVDGRSMSQYLEWFAKTLKIDCSMVIFCEESLNDFIGSHRPLHLETKIVNQPLEKIPYFHLKDKIDAILTSESYTSKVKDPSRIECKTSLYSIIQYSKFPWAKHAVENNYFNADYFFWMDAGFSRLVPDLDLSSKFPGKHFSEQVRNFPEVALFQVYAYPYTDLFSSVELTEDYFYDNRSYVMGGLFGSDKSGIAKLANSVDEVLQNLMISTNRLGNDQIAIGYLLKKKKQDFLVLVNNRNVHRNFELLYQAFS